LADTHYILSKQNPDLEVRKILRKFKVLVNVLSLDNKNADLALNSEFRDFEDAIQYYTAIENDQDIIITRNQHDFENSKIPIMTAGEFINLIWIIKSAANTVSCFWGNCFAQYLQSHLNRISNP